MSASTAAARAAEAEEARVRRAQRAALDAIYGEVSEASLQRWLLGYARTLGFLAYHTHFSIRSESGFPDTVLVDPRRGRLLIAELKTMRGKLSRGRVGSRGQWLTGQDDWLRALARGGGACVYLWRPHQQGEIERVLRDGEEGSCLAHARRTPVAAG